MQKAAYSYTSLFEGLANGCIFISFAFFKFATKTIPPIFTKSLFLHTQENAVSEKFLSIFDLVRDTTKAVNVSKNMTVC